MAKQKSRREKERMRSTAKDAPDLGKSPQGEGAGQSGRLGAADEPMHSPPTRKGKKFGHN